MTSATVSGVTTTFAYRGDGLRNSRTVGGNTTTFTWDVAAGFPVVLDDGAKYVYGLGLISQKTGSNTYYYLSDGLGEPMSDLHLELCGYLVRRVCHASEYVTRHQAHNEPVRTLKNDRIIGPQAKRRRTRLSSDERRPNG